MFFTFSNQLSVDSSEADKFIEQLMHEAQTDPKLRALAYGGIEPSSHMERGNNQPNLNESYPMVKEISF
jgi:hypothetical protein